MTFVHLENRQTEERPFPKRIPKTVRKSIGFPNSAVGEESAWKARDAGLIPGSGRSPGGGNGNPLQHSCLENPMDRGASGLQSRGSHRVTHDCAHDTLSTVGVPKHLKQVKQSNPQQTLKMNTEDRCSERRRRRTSAKTAGGRTENPGKNSRQSGIPSPGKIMSTASGESQPLP